MTTAAPATITTLDPQTRVQVTWVIHHLEEAGAGAKRSGWTHFLTATRQNGRKAYGMWLVMDTDGTVKKASRAFSAGF